jgi:hypothetical protein
MSCVLRRRDCNWLHIPRTPAQLAEGVFAVPRSPTKAQSREVSTLTEGSPVLRAYVCMYVCVCLVVHMDQLTPYQGAARDERP